ncbi:HlyD family efflux transporter periplasmic adaptor subunit [Sulfitobacter sp. M57]|uniref:efflux RND transporter periplasmic adaptor subunit n=1 Tax=unclassified Sulfitobacter TaxID=196795 RepID=UPI0023E13ACE|nr:MULTISPECIES: HlyD family efflux transporter periplasmic adaptor subunit [unclassified Sulfitobacter]MDF3415544.1 HlyD family efflux transporter periplasmic adaptor subunit [Sulfitobacter sp. KE5]MDF3423025.1 HlyD family efflux transporter periplasmic adaptor subunit [Sulfitobacter sp. KE43]MDF3434090.1 HlyD family efflux transporter periplasmic adaptor subunit [Sulfitobacter sp. KE42]MDF3459877.1 HlyD family efflux transporter periplasmic adaptor subunit [Sulfitobacter sp. S74]MDF3463629.1
MRFLRQSMIGLFLAACTIGLLVFAAAMVGGAVKERMAEDPKAPPVRERVFAVNVITAQAEDIVPVLETFGEVQSRRLLELRAAGGGRVVELAEGFEDGGRVTAGQVLVRLDPADAQSAVDRAQSDVADALAEGRDAARSLELAGAELDATQLQADLRTRAFERQQGLAQRGVGTAATTEAAELAAAGAQQLVVSRRQAVAQAEARLDQTKTRLARARITLAEAERRLTDTTLTAPFDGTLSATDVVVGRRVSANERLAELIDPQDLEVSFRLSTAQYARLLDENAGLVNAEVTVLLDITGVDLEAKGRISRASAAAGEGATGRLIFAALGNAGGFKPGDFVTVRVQEPLLENVTRLPASAVDAQGELLVLDQENRLEAVRVEILRRQGDDVLVRGAILGRQVVEARSPLLGGGIAVKPVIRGAPPSEPEMLELSAERRAKLVAFVEANQRMPKEAKARVLARLAEPTVPAQMVARIESRMGG